MNNEVLKSCTAAVKISPQEVNARHSDCLTKFIVSGRTVSLIDSEDDKEAKIKKQHFVTAHAGTIYLHRIMEPQKLNEPPQLSDGSGGKRNDYRSKEFYNLLKQFTLHPTKSKNQFETNIKRIENATRIRLYRFKSYLKVTTTTISLLNYPKRVGLFKYLPSFILQELNATLSKDNLII